MADYDQTVPEGPTETGPAKPWLNMLADAERTMAGWQTKCDKIDKLYSDLEALAETKTDRQLQIMWANMEVLKPTIYSRPPTPQAVPRFRDRKELPRRAADILERALLSDFEADAVHDTMLLARDDLTINARGVVWMTLRKRDEMDVACAEHIDRKDFRHGAARKWSEVPWVARRAWMTRKEAVERFEKLPVGMSFGHEDLGGETSADAEKKAAVWEIWHRAENKVVFVAEGTDTTLEERDPWLNLTGFFPCPRPAYGTLKRGTLVPVPDFVYYRDQVEEINEITARISALTESLRLRGFYPAGNADVGEALETAMKSLDDRAILIPVSSLSALGPNASLRDAIIWLPVVEVANVITQLIALRQQLIQDVYEITGLSDIMRGATQAAETATAQSLKAQYGAVRVRERQGEMVRLARDITRMKAEILAEEVPIESLLTMSQVDDLPTNAEIGQKAQQIAQQAEAQMVQLMETAEQAKAQAQAAVQSGQMPQEQYAQMHAQGEQAIAQQAQQIQQEAQAQIQQLNEVVTVEKIAQLFRDQRTRPFILDIETDSTIEPDQAREKETRVEFLGAIGPLVQQGVAAMQAAPQIGPFMAATIRFAASGFDVDRTMEEAIDELAEGLENYQPPQQQDDGRAQVEQMKAEIEKMKADAQVAVSQSKVQEAQARVQIDAQRLQADMASRQADAQIKAQEAAVEAQQADADMAMQQHEAGIEERESDARIAHLEAQVQKIMAEIGRIAVSAQQPRDDFNA